jgi:hypothetical protein
MIQQLGGFPPDESVTANDSPEISSSRHQTWQPSRDGRAPLRQLELANIHEGQRLMSE